jgi:hypothetical protein
MGFDVVSYDGEELNMGRAWPGMLDLARTYGWEPCGTTQSKEIIRGLPNPVAGQPWSGGYLTNEYQTVSDADAFALRDALQRAKAAIEPVQGKSARIRTTVATLMDKAGARSELFGSDEPAVNIDLVSRLIAFLDRGRFSIW